MLVLRTNLNAIPMEQEEEDLLEESFKDDETISHSRDKPQFIEHGLTDYASFEKAVWNLVQEECFRKDLEFEHPSWGTFYENDVWSTDFM